MRPAHSTYSYPQTHGAQVHVPPSAHYHSPAYAAGLRPAPPVPPVPPAPLSTQAQGFCSLCGRMKGRQTLPSEEDWRRDLQAELNSHFKAWRHTTVQRLGAMFREQKQQGEEDSEHARAQAESEKQSLLRNIDAQKLDLTRQLAAKRDHLMSSVELSRRRIVQTEQQAELKVSAARSKIEEERQWLERMKVRVEEDQRKAMDVVVVDVGGSKFTTTKATLTSVEGSYLEHMLNDDQPEESSTKLKKIVDDSGAIFIDRNGKLFEPVLEFLRNNCHGRVLVPSGSTVDEVEQELEFYGLPFHRARAGDGTDLHKQPAGACPICASSRPSNPGNSSARRSQPHMPMRTGRDFFGS